MSGLNMCPVDDPTVIPRHVEKRRVEFCEAMSRRTLMKKFFESVSPCCFFWKDTTANSGTLPNDKENPQDNTPQYTVRRKKKEHRNILSKIYDAIRLFCCFGSVVSLQNVNTKSKYGLLPNPNRSLIDFLNWMYRTSFLLLFLCFATFFYVLCLIFGLLIMWVGKNEPECISIGDETYGSLSNGAGFAGTFTLSWTTLSTVGYGNVAPAVDGHGSEDIRDCFSINFLLMVEAFVGVIYAGFCGAILFGKVLRFQSRAPVVFSDPLLIRVSTGVTKNCARNSFFTRDTNDSPPSQVRIQESKKIPELVDPPILEFRLVNLLHDEQAGEIIGASLQVVASKNADDTDPEVLEFSQRKREKTIERQIHMANARRTSGGSREIELTTGQLMSSEDSLNESDDGIKPIKNRLKRISKISKNAIRKFGNMNGNSSKSSHDAEKTDDEGNRDLIPKIMFSNVQIEEPKHPLFKRVWIGQHILDETSPLLNDRVKSKIKKRQGLWHKSQCTATTIKKCLDFNQIIVSITGVSNVTGSEVYAHRIYDFKDLIVGYEFVDILLQDNNGITKLDMGGLNCVVSQFSDHFKDYMDHFQ